MWPIIICSIIAVAIILDRAYSFYLARPKVHSSFPEIKEYIQQKNFEAVLNICRASLTDPIAQLLVYALELKTNDQEEYERKLVRYGSQLVRQLERRINYLAIIANATPLLGLLGTVIGMIKAFMQIQQLNGQVNASVLAGGIWEALITTAAGLTVAIPSLVIYHYFESKLDRITLRIKDTIAEFLEIKNNVS